MEWEPDKWTTQVKKFIYVLGSMAYVDKYKTEYTQKTVYKHFL